MLDAVNKAIDLGWRVVSNNGSYHLVPPEGEQEYTACRYIGVPLNLIAWVEARTLQGPDESKRHCREAQVKKWFNLEWKGYLEECGDDESYARDLIIQDAACDFAVDMDLVEEWFDERK
jgi:hypothetical protein